MKSLLLVGGGGHCLSCIDVIEAQGIFAIQGIVEHSGQGHSPVLGYPVVGNDADLGSLLELTPAVLIAVGQIKNATARIALYELLLDLGAELPVIVSPASHVSAHASIGQGTIIMHGAIVNALATIGRNCIINSQALIEHDVIVRDHCHISTGACVNGGTEIGSGTFIGSGAVLRDGIRVGSNCVIGAGAVVLDDIPDGTKYFGISPWKVLSQDHD
jgi:sugar O-acyltransferase (sialic acid O-acetyltransferase NeuD family)